MPRATTARCAAVATAALLTLTTAAVPASAVFPGLNGKIYYHDGTGDNVDVYSVNPDGTERGRLTTDPGVDTSPVVSPDGRKVAFISTRSGDEQVWVMNADGSGQTRVSGDGVVGRGFVVWVLSWSPDGRVFYANRDEVIVSVNADGTGHASTGVRGADPVVSPKGDRIAYVRPSSAIGGGDLWVSDPGGGNPVRLTDNPDYTSAWHPDWSPDGTRIAFTLFSRVTSGTAVVNADGTGLTTLTGGPTEYGPQWSPDGTRVLVTAALGRAFDVVKPDGTGRTRLAASPGGPTATIMAGDWAVATTADAAITLTAAAPPIGARIDYTLTVTNNGPAPLTSATVVLTLPAGSIPAQAPTGCTPAGAQVTCVIGPLDPGKSTQRAIRANAGLLVLGQLNARATRVAGTPQDPNPANDTAAATCASLTALIITC
ncbi:putative repeat protein (TIGR01451 family) [Actinokineospora baliensis]|uniref:DUF11 domain-containing protein n=1 Tax=Actinokineospora baliensis TaxID=547056 RepID=UPI00195DE1BC|nr:DUF11 domain-containing protein [Actinokineospora baliensis]MBM7774461.1 putative repeat protein (TIGR01451 family) [Actinokineospora baliensis]